MAGASHRCAVREGIDMNSEPAPAEEEEEEEAAGGASPRSGASSVVNGDTKGSISDEEEDGTEGTRKKLRLSKEQSAVLEETFRVHVAPNTTRKAELAKQLNLRTRQVEVWFQNRRARIKLKQTGVTCDFLKKRCEMLEEANRWLVSEVQQLRSLKLFPPQLYMARPPTAVPVCLSCQREPPSLPSPPGHRPLHSYPIPKLMPRGIPARPWTEPGKSCVAKTCNSDTPREEMKGCTVYPLKKGEIFIFKKDEKEMGGENGPTAPESSTRKRSREFV